MELRLTTINGDSVGTGIADILKRRLEQVSNSDAKSSAANALAKCIADYWSSRFPNSDFYSPNCISVNGDSVDIDNPGVGRAYHDVDIFPTNAEYLAIPLTDFAKSHKSPRDIDGLFKPKNHDVLATNENGTLVCHYALSKHVHQSQDRTIMPTEDAMYESVKEAVVNQLD